MLKKNALVVDPEAFVNKMLSHLTDSFHREILLGLGAEGYAELTFGVLRNEDGQWLIYGVSTEFQINALDKIGRGVLKTEDTQVRIVLPINRTALVRANYKFKVTKKDQTWDMLFSQPDRVRILPVSIPDMEVLMQRDDAWQQIAQDLGYTIEDAFNWAETY